MQEPYVLDDRHLVLAARDGDQAAFEVLVRRHVDRLYGAARLMLRDTDLAEDAVQQALVRAWRDLDSLRDPTAFGSWLQRLLVHACYDEARRKRRWSANVRLVPLRDVDARPVSDLDTREILDRAFRTLSVDHRVILALHFYLDLEPAEIADRLRIPAGTARSRLHYAIAAMRAAVESDERRGSTSAGRPS
jgi:RNA polymerase sigma-70 factor (ECF subfamily)